MSGLTREQSIKLAALLGGVLSRQGGNIADVAKDIPKLIEIGHDVAGAVDAVKAAGDHPITAPATPARAAPEPHPAPKSEPPAPVQPPKPAASPARPAAKVSKAEMVHVAQSGGLTAAEKAAFARAAQQSG